MKRFLFNNLIYRLSEDNYVLINLINFRRQIISEENLHTLMSLENKKKTGEEVLQNEKLLYDYLIAKKQIFLPETIKKVETELSKFEFPKIYNIKNFTINLTHECNFSCAYCYQNAYKSRNDFCGYMTESDIDKIYEFLNCDKFNTDNIEEIIISGGEPLLDHNINVINKITTDFKTTKFTMFTNGVNIIKFKDCIDFSKFSNFQISFDGTNEIIKKVNMPKIKDGNIFQEIIDGIKYLQSLGKDIEIVVTLTKQLIDNIDSFIDVISKNFLKDNIKFKFSLIKNYYNEDPVINSFYSFEYICKKAKVLNRKLFKINSGMQPFREIGKLQYLVHRKIDERIYPKIKTCDINAALPMIFEPNGKIYWCLCLGNDNGCIGNFKEKKLFEDKIYNISKRTVLANKKCSKCELRFLCGGGCPLPLIAQNLDVNSPACGLYSSKYLWDNLEEIV